MNWKQKTKSRDCLKSSHGLSQMNLRRFLFKKRLFRSFFSIALCILVCEFLIPFFYIFRCNWPINDLNDDFNLKAIVLSDTHLFGLKRGYFFDKFKREWNMYLAYQLAIRLFRPNSVLFLGDIFDEGLIAGRFFGNLLLSILELIFHVLFSKIQIKKNSKNIHRDFINFSRRHTKLISLFRSAIMMLVFMIE